MSVTRSCPSLCDPTGCSPPGSSIDGILQARALEWVAISSCRGLPDPKIKPRFPIPQADSLPNEPPGKPLNMETNVSQTALTLEKQSEACFLHGPQGKPVSWIFLNIVYKVTSHWEVRQHWQSSQTSGGDREQRSRRSAGKGGSGRLACPSPPPAPHPGS